jgi:DNA-binding NarL/FixJ family response regulator
LQYYSENSASDDVDITPHVTGETSEYLGRLLIGDDEPRLLNSLCSILRDKGFEVDGAEDGDAVCQRLRENAYDLVLLDIRMPGRSGLESMAWLKETGVDAPVIIISGHSDHRIVRQAFKLGACDYLVSVHKRTVFKATRLAGWVKWSLLADLISATSQPVVLRRHFDQ